MSDSPSPNKSNVRIDPEETQDEPIFELCLEILKNNTNKRYFLHLDSKHFEVDVELLRKALNISPRKPDTQFTQPPTSDGLILFIKRLGYAGSLTTVSQVVVNKLHQPWRTLLNILNRSLTGKASGIDRAREQISQILWGIVNAKNVDFVASLWEDFRFQINKHKNIGNKHETIPYLRFTKLIIRYLLSQHPTLYKCLDSTTNLVFEDTLLENMKYVAKGERKPIFEMPIPEALLSSELKESQAYAAYMDKYPQAQVPHKHGMGKGFMKMGNIPKPKKKKVVAPTQSESYLAEDNEVSNDDEDLEYTKQVNIEEFENQEKERRTKHRHARIVLERQVNKKVDEGHNHLKVKLKAKEQPSPEALLLLNLKKQGKESKKQAILEEIKRKDKGKGFGAAPKSPNHSSSSTNSSKSNDDKTKKSSEYDESDKDSDNGVDQTCALVIKPTPSSNVITSAEYISRSTQATTVDPTEYELKQQLYEKMFQTAAYLNHLKHRSLYDALANSMQIDEQETRFRSTKPSQSKRTHYDQDDTDNHEGEKKSKRRRKDAGESSSKKSKAQKVPPHFETGNDADEPRQEGEPRHDDEQVHKVRLKESLPEEYEYRDGSVTQFCKLVKKIFKKDVITKDNVNGPSFELLKRTCKNNIELEYNMNQVSLALTDQIDWVNPETNDRFQNDLSKPLPLTGPYGKKRKSRRYFFNHDLEYLMNGTKENTYALSVTKTKAARYEDEGIEEMIPSL
ncbi:hypothetical protein Tco_0468661 [Tanacetum coccineum]